MACLPRQPPYVADLRRLAASKKIPGYSKMTKAELCAALGITSGVQTPAPKRKVVRKKPPTKKKVPEVTRGIDEYVKANGLIARSVKEPTRPPPGMADYYYLWFTPASGKPYRRYLMGPEDPVASGNPVASGTLKAWTLDDLTATAYTPIYGSGLDAWVKPSASYAVVSKRKGLAEYLRELGESREDFRKRYGKGGWVQAELRRAGKTYQWP